MKTTRKAIVEARSRVIERSGGACEAVAPGCTGWAQHVHHVLRRSQGGDVDPALLLAVCTTCHGYIHDHPALSYERGWLVRGVR